VPAALVMNSGASSRSRVLIIQSRVIIGSLEIIVIPGGNFRCCPEYTRLPAREQRVHAWMVGMADCTFFRSPGGQLDVPGGRALVMVSIVVDDTLQCSRRPLFLNFTV
jgi:hypothetical protein